jgi:hypothetical protein
MHELVPRAWQAVEVMWEHLKGARVLGIDVEWRPDVASNSNSPASIVQVCPDLNDIPLQFD